MTTDQLAAEARDEIRALGKGWLKDSIADDLALSIIKAACEKAYAQGKCDMAHYIESVEREAPAHASDDWRQPPDSYEKWKAAHASNLFVCNKCGYAGATKEHKGCNYLAARAHASSMGEGANRSQRLRAHIPERAGWTWNPH